MRETHLKGNEREGVKEVPIYTPLYAATEGLIGFNPNPKKESYVLCNAMYYEFIPEHEMHTEKPKVLTVDEIELEKNYELVITTYSGLARYRFGDVIKIVGFYNEAPEIEFKYRSGQLLDCFGEKTRYFIFSEKLFQPPSFAFIFFLLKMVKQ